MLNPVASTIITLFAILSMLVFIGAMAGIALALNKVNAKLEELTVKIDPLLTKADQILTVTNEKITSIGDKTEGILQQGEEVAETVHEKVDRTATSVQRVVHAPIIRLNSLAAGLTRGMETFGRLQQRQETGFAAAATLPSDNPPITTVHTDGRNGQEEAAVIVVSSAPH